MLYFYTEKKERRDKVEELFTCTMDIGEQMLLAGAEVHRVEDSIHRMCSAIGYPRADVFIITSSMVVTVYDGDGRWMTQTRRVSGISTDSEKLHRLNQLSRDICSRPMTAEEIRRDLTAAVDVPALPFWADILCCAVIAGAFTLFFGGGMAETAVSFGVGGAVRLCSLGAEKTVGSRIFLKFLSTFLATALAFAAVRLHLIPTVDKIIIGNIMSLIPGIGLTNSLRDLFTGDSIAGILRFTESALTALAIAAGYFLVILIGGGLA